MTTPDKEEMAAKHRNAADRLDNIPQLIAAEPEIAVGLTFFVNHWGLDGYSPPNGVRESVRGIITLALNAARTALSTLPVNDRNHSGSDSYQADAGAPALFEKVNVRSEWLPIESAPRDGTWFLGWNPTGIIEDQVQVYSWHNPGLGDPPWWINAADSNDGDDQPTHWMPLPSPPDAELNFSNEAERDGVSLKPDTSSQPASEAGKLSTDTLGEA